MCKTARRIISKAILTITKWDLQEIAGSAQLCAGQVAGIEAAIHAMRETFLDSDTEAILLVDASNAFNSLNRKAALLNIKHTCPTLTTVLINIYRNSSELVIDKLSLSSEEGTTQGDPLAMPMYALAVVPLICQLKVKVPDASQVWYVDDAAAAGKLTALRSWWDNITELRPPFGYHANASKTWLIVKKSVEAQARSLFSNTQINITSEGRPYLGAALGTQEYVRAYVSEKVRKWIDELNTLSTIAATQPHAAFAAFIHRFIHKFQFICRVCPDTEHLLQSLEESIHSRFIPAITGRDPPEQLNQRPPGSAHTFRRNGPGQTNYPSLCRVQRFTACCRTSKECHLGARWALFIPMLGGPNGCEESST